jgi:hypothetical protein
MGTMNMTPSDDGNPLPARTLKFSRRMVALSLLLIGAGAVFILNPWPYAMVAGVACCAGGFAVFFSAGYYWACGNEGCS